jgi:protein CpxP
MLFKVSTWTKGLTLFAIASSVTGVLAVPTPPISPPVLLTQSSSPSSSPPSVNIKHKDLFQQLNLTEQQKQQLSSIRQKYRGPMQQLLQQQRAAQDQLAQLMAGSGSESAIRDKNREITNLMQKLSDLRLNSLLEIRKVMTAEQRSQLSQLMKAKSDQRRQNR